MWNVLVYKKMSIKHKVHLFGWIALFILIGFRGWFRLNDAMSFNYLALQTSWLLNGWEGAVTADIPPMSGAYYGRELAFEGLIAAHRGNTSDGIMYLQQATEEPNSRPYLWLQLSDLYARSGQFEASLQVLQNFGGDKLASTRCGSALWNQGNLDLASRWCPLLEKLDNLNAEDACLLGKYYQISGQPTRAQTAYEHATVLPDVNDQCLYQYGVLLYGQGEYSQAADVLKLAMNRAPKAYADYVLALGRAYAASQRPELAVGMYELAYELAPQGILCANILGAMGEIYLLDPKFKDTIRARDLFRQAIECNSGVDVTYYYLLAHIYRDEGRSEEALTEFAVVEQRLAGTTYLLEWRHEYAAYLVMLGREPEARSVYLRILIDAPDDPIAADFLNK